MPFSLINKPTHNHESISPAFNISILTVIGLSLTERDLSSLGSLQQLLYDHPK